MIIKKNSWHYKLNMKYRNDKMRSMKYHGTSLCEYMQVTLITILSILFKVFVASILIGVISIILSLLGMTISIVGLPNLFGTTSLIVEYTNNISNFNSVLKYGTYTLFGLLIVSITLALLFLTLKLIGKILAFIAIKVINYFKKLKAKNKDKAKENVSTSTISLIKAYVKDKHNRVCRKIDFED